MKVKVVLAAAVRQNPHVLILDDPTNYLDREGLGALVLAINDYKGGVLIISHNKEVSDVPSETLEAAVEQAPALEAELDEASGDGEKVTFVPALDVEATRVRIAELERVQAVEESFQEAVEADIEGACEGRKGGSGGDMPVCVTVLNSSGRNGAAGVVPGGDRPRVMLASVEELNAETEEWIKGTGVALDVASEPVAGERQVSFASSDFVCRWSCELSRVCCDRQAEIGDTVMAAMRNSTEMVLRPF